ncbi:MAG: DUF998 domain-containing protein [Nocardioidaceae bacterium]
MGSVPWWGLLSSGAAPVLLIGGWTLAGALQPAGFDPLVESISALAARDAASREVMSLAFFGVGICHLTTAAALRPVPTSARALLAIGGVATIGVAALPLPGGGADSLPHAAAAIVALVAIAAWPALAGRPHSIPVLRPLWCVGMAAVLLLHVGWFFVSVVADAPLLGLSERIAAGAQSMWPFVVVAALRHMTRAAVADG